MDDLGQDWRAGGFGLYVHWPFCESKCPYCDFNSHVSARVDQARWQAALVSEIERVAALTGRRVLTSIFFGGGTPSLMEPDVVAAVIDTARSVFAPSNGMEITLEANPSSVESSRFAAYRQAGVERISIGVQALNDADLSALGRRHDLAQALRALEIARGLFARVSFDLIYARQNQSLQDWDRELSQALSLGPDHLSLYQLTIEDGTAFGARFAAGILRGLPGEDLAANMFALTQERCEAAGLPAYETSNHARPGAEGRHNLTYWRSGDYAGVGPGAHGRLTLNGQRLATEAHRSPEAWLTAVEQAGSGESLRDALGAEERLQEFLLMGLRLREGVLLDRLAALGGRAEMFAEVQDLGLVEVSDDRVVLTEAGRPLLDGVLRRVLA